MRLLAALVLLPALSAQIKITWGFEGGNLGRVETVSASHARAHLAGETDQDGRNRQANWYYFQVDAPPNQPLLIDLVSLPGEYNYKPNRGAVTADTPPVLSFDNRTWTHVESFDYDPAEPRMRLRITPKTGRFWIAHTPPYTNAHLASLRQWAGSRLQEETIGKTVDGRPLVLWTIGNGPQTVWLFFRQHSWESGSSWVGEGLVRHLLSGDGAALRKQLTWKIYPLCDPDGVARGGVRFNKFGFDLNRNWDVNGVEKMPEITAQRAAIRRWLDAGHSVDFLLSLHNTETAEYLEGPPEKGGKFAPLAEKAFGLLETETSFAPTRKLFYAETTTTANMPGRMNVSQGLYRDFGLPAFIMEQRVSLQPKYGRKPLIADRLRFGRELAVTIGRTLAP
ncbi:MAG TPA: M14-type cytosolic carboxypeptidase [Bryobacteraceae bacterium]|nr:M14-type cytosolic carboxypeptidase [Bryobacteraceae bacterium]